MYLLNMLPRRLTWAPVGILLSLSASWVLGASGAAAALPRGYELVSPPDVGTHVFAPVGYGNPVGVMQTWNAVAADGSKVLWSVRVALPGVDSTGRTDSYLSKRGSSGWGSAYATPPGSTHAFANVTNLMWASADLDNLIWQDGELYRRDSDGDFSQITQGSLVPPDTGGLNSVVGASPDGRAVVFTDTRAFEPGASAGGNVYERRDGKTSLVSVDESGSAAGGAGLASSDDGDVVVFRGGSGNELYIRDRGLSRTVHLQSNAIFQFESLSADGTKLFVLSSAPLTGDDSDSSVDLFEYDDTTTPGTFTRLSKSDGPGGPGPGNTDACGVPLPNFGQCDVSPVAVSRDGSKAYFVSPERLDETKGVDGGVNLYLAQNGLVQFVATLDGTDPDFGRINGSPVGTQSARHVRLTPDGSKLLFESRAQVTSYDNAGHVEIYLHDPSAGSVVCVSCRPDGTAPSGDASLRDGTGGSRVQFSTEPMYPANADESGERVFFQSTDTLVPQDLNTRYDVYERDLAAGVTKLISSGTSENDSIYLGNGIDGKDVFFFTTDTLDPSDRNGGLFKLYDAREGGGFPPPSPPPPPCVAEGCRPPVAPTPGLPVSGTSLTGPGSRSNRSGGQFAPRAKVSVSGARFVRGTAGRLSVRISGPGRLRLSGPGVVATALSAKKAAEYRISVRLSRRERAKLRRVGRLSVRVTLRFVPGTGAAQSVGVKMTFISTSKRGRA